MGLKVGIIGLPNVGKSTLFNAIMGKQAALTAPYPFATIEPNVGVVDVPDERLTKLRDAMFPSKSSEYSENSESQNIGKSENLKTGISGSPAHRYSELSGTPSIPSFPKQPPLVYSSIQFVDIAGLVKGASEGNGLGNKFLSHIRDVDLILHVLRDFEADGVPRHQDSKDPVHDAEIVEMELELKDLELKEKNLQYGDYLSKKPVIYAINVDEKKLGEAPKESSADPSGFGRSNDILSPSSKMSGSSEKPVIYAVNVSEEKLKIISEHSENSDHQSVGPSDDQTVRNSGIPSLRSFLKDKRVLFFCAKIEEEIAQLPKIEQKEFMKVYGMETSGLDRIITECFHRLGLISFFTAGPKEVRAWPVRQRFAAGVAGGPVKKGSTAPQAAGTIHSDFEKLFIRAEIIEWEKMAQAGSWQAAKEKGLVRTEGRDYVMRDGEVCNFLIGK